MKVAKQAVQYYTLVTGNEWSTFYDNLDTALAEENPTGDLFIIKRLMNAIIKSGISVNEFKMNKDAVKALFDNESRKANGEFFTPIVWAKELYTYIDKFIPNWRTDFNIWENSCYDIQTKVLIRRKVSESSISKIRDFYTKEDVDVIWYSTTYDSTSSFSNPEWLYKDGGTLIARVSAKLLEPDDEILTMDRVTEEQKWSGYHNLFFKTAKKMIRFFFGISSKLKVTIDHQMVVKIDRSTSYLSISALDLCRVLDENHRVYIKLRDNSEILITSYDIFNIEREVWDLTTDNDTHCFCVTTQDGVDVFSGNCGSGNLLRESRADMSHVYMSSLQEDDITLVKNTPEFEGVNAFQCDFLQGIDYDEYNTEFLDKLPPRLKEIIVNDEPLLIICNPPYKTGSAKATDVGRYMCDIGMGRPAYDIFYQFCWRVMRFVEMFNLSNCYYAFFGPLTFFTGAGANILLTEFEHCFEFLDGMCISAQEFSDTSESILWGIGGTVWKSRGGYQKEQSHKDILLEKKYLLPDGGVGCEGRVLYAPPREKLSDWVAPKDITFFNNAPLMTSHLTFKGSEVFDKVAPKSGKLADNALGTLMVGNTLTRSSDQSAILSMPSTIQYVNITEENFWRCVASYTFRRTYDAGWAVAKKEISAPDTTVEGYDVWLKNALVMFLFEYKSMMSSLRGVSWGGYDNYVIRNKLFYLSEEEIRANCHDEVILHDLDEHPLQNQFMLKMIAESEPYWSPEIRALYDWCKNYTLFTLDKRKEVNYKGSLDCADAGFQQLRTGGLWNDQLSEELTKIIVQARDYMRKDLDKFGFVSETEDADL